MLRPFPKAKTVVVHGAKDAVVTLKEVGGFLVEMLEFGLEGTSEVLEHKGCWWLLGWGEPAPIEVGFDGTIGVRVVKVQGEGRRVGER